MTNTIPYEIELCKLWLKNKTLKMKTIRRNRTTYGYKHDVERLFGHYIHESSFISACEELNYKIDKKGFCNIKVI